MRTVSFGADVDDKFSEMLARCDRGVVGKTNVTSINIGDFVFNRYNGIGEVVKESKNCWYICFEGDNIRLMQKDTATKYLYKL